MPALLCVRTAKRTSKSANGSPEAKKQWIYDTIINNNLGSYRICRIKKGIRDEY